MTSDAPLTTGIPCITIFHGASMVESADFSLVFTQPAEQIFQAAETFEG
ncbi:MAG: hypothetical protein ACHBN1_07440 [Heteroscytonema crispum UTEX LB 1556]